MKNAKTTKPVWAITVDNMPLPTLYYTREEAREARSFFQDHKTGVKVSVARLVSS